MRSKQNNLLLHTKQVKGILNMIRLLYQSKNIDLYLVITRISMY